MSKKLMMACLLGSSATLAATGAFADNGIQYNYLEGRIVVDAEHDGSNADGDGFGFGGSLRLDEMMYVVADYEELDLKHGIDASMLQAGVGFIFPYQKVDGIAEAALLYTDISGTAGDDTEIGYRLSAGARGYVIPKLELRGTVNMTRAFDEDDTYLEVAADYFINDQFSVNLTKEIASDWDRIAVGVRYYFGE